MMYCRPFTVLWFALVAALVGCVSTPPPAPTAPAPTQQVSGSDPVRYYVLVVPVRPRPALPNPPNVQLRQPGSDAGTAATDLDDAVDDYVNWASEFQRRIAQVLAHDRQPAPMPGRCTPRCTPRGCTCD